MNENTFKRNYEPKWISNMCEQDQIVEIISLDGEIPWGKIRFVGSFELDFECYGI